MLNVVACLMNSTWTDPLVEMLGSVVLFSSYDWKRPDGSKAVETGNFQDRSELNFGVNVVILITKLVGRQREAERYRGRQHLRDAQIN